MIQLLYLQAWTRRCILAMFIIIEKQNLETNNPNVYWHKRKYSPAMEKNNELKVTHITMILLFKTRYWTRKAIFRAPSAWFIHTKYKEMQNTLTPCLRDTRVCGKSMKASKIVIDKKIPDIIYPWQMGGCRDACKSSVGISEESLLSWEVFELLFYFLYFTYILNIFLCVPKF